jgi:hypothetical protein
METRMLFCAASLALLASGAHASSHSWEFRLDGSGLYAGGGTEGCSPDHPEQCLQNVTWTGTFMVETAAGADGVYVGSDILEIRMMSNFASVDFTSFPYSAEWQVAPSVTVSGGRVTSIEVQWVEEPEIFSPASDFIVQGLQARYDFSGYHAPFAQLAGTLTSVPEPAPVLTALAGLACVLLRRGRRGGSSAARIRPAPGSSPAASTPSGS